MTTNATTRRAVLAGPAALPTLALALPDSADPAIAAVRRWVAACMAERAYHYTGDDDP